MSYCNYQDMALILPEKVKISDQNIGTPSVTAGNQGSNRSNISIPKAVQYIKKATEWIDARLRPFYVCPLSRIKQFETDVLNNPSHGSQVRIVVEDSGSFITGNLIRIQNYDTMETAVVTDTPDLVTVVVDKLVNNYLSADGTKISVLQYPDPVPLITAQMASSFALDSLWASEQAPDSSKFGVTMRNLARAQMDNILSGEVLLMGQNHTGRRFIRMSLLDAFSSPAEVQKGVEKE